ncbi:DUF3945 domain-containing protein [Bifidobacterium imperatoris]|uniref:C-terminal repeat of topoisomerase n=1 Tax=Bifidobacterium imperatoris TaxID=2020965 RepID=A0A2N5IPL9_9BIFI|nr:DUF3945 domain-containing protein [Bifidobacterium imperatoris]PLS23905.1 C-terminal repeat of topoisomerase [Bifidobacterium imperatoris]QSY58428.1 DUF3945 domain-containing protein [Bifidobacterium imperatoris]
MTSSDPLQSPAQQQPQAQSQQQSQTRTPPLIKIAVPQRPQQTQASASASQQQPQQPVEVPAQAFGHTFTPQERQLLQAGYVLYLTGLVSKAGNLYAADIILNRQTGRVEFFKGIPTHFHGVPLDEGQRGALANNMIVYVSGLVSKKGKPYDADIVWNQEAGKLEFYKGVPTHFRGAPLSPVERQKLAAGRKITFKGLLDPDPFYRQRGRRNDVDLRFDPETGRLRNVDVPLEYRGRPLTYSERLHLAVGDDVTIQVTGKDGKPHKQVLSWNRKTSELFRRDFAGHVLTDEEFQQLDAGETIYLADIDADVLRDPKTGHITFSKEFPSHYMGFSTKQLNTYTLIERGQPAVFYDNSNAAIAIVYWDQEKGRLARYSFMDMPDEFMGEKLSRAKRATLAEGGAVKVRIDDEYGYTIYSVWYDPEAGCLDGDAIKHQF